MMCAKLILADDNAATRSALAFILSRRLGLKVAGEAASVEELAWLLNSGAPEADILILDWDLPGLSQAIGLTELRKLNPVIRLVVISARADVRQQALDAGADAFVSMVEPPEALLAAIQAMDVKICSEEN
jgi:DNA-binding NarL/FixJ family response regulator